MRPVAPDVAAGRLVVFGAGGHGKVVFDALVAGGHRVHAFVDDRVVPGRAWCGVPVLPLSDLPPGPVQVALGVGGNAAREIVAARVEERGHRLVTCIHPSAVVSAAAVVGRGAYVGALAVVNPAAVVGEGAIVNTAAVLEHDVLVGRFSHVCPRAVVGGGGVVGDGALLGTGAVVLPLGRVGHQSTVGAGAVVLREVPDRTVAVGVPARLR